MANGKFIAYYRVSTERQGKSGLGLEAQQRAVKEFLNGGAWELAGEYTEIESGKRADRPELTRALAMCRATGATLIVAKLDRLSRSVSFISTLMDSGVEFRACDMPEASRVILHIMAAMAQHERELISARTKAALQSAKERGVKLGGDRGNLQHVNAIGRQRGLESRQEAARRRAADLAPIIAEIRATGVTSVKGLARELNARGIPATRGGQWQTTQVQALLALAV